MVRICIQKLWIPFKRLEFAFECFESLSNGLNLDSNPSNPFRMVRICIRMPFWIVRICIRILPIPFECFEFAFKCFESLSNGLNLDSNALNPFRMVLICVRILQILFEWSEFTFECFESFESLSNGLDLLLILIQIPQIPFEWLEFACKCFESFLNC